MIATSATHRLGTGPITEDGKNRSRLNAVTHGFTASVPVSEEDRAEMERAIAEWTKEIGPVGLPEEALVRQAAVASIRLERCQEAEQEAMETNVREALKRWEKKKRHQVRRRAQGMADDPAGTVEELERSAFGCDWMLRQWEDLDITLEKGKGWNREQFERAARLSGFDPRTVSHPSDDPGWRRFWRLAHHAAPEEVPALPYPAAPGESVPCSAAEIRGELRRIAEAHRERLEARRAEVWEEVDGPERDGVKANGRIDISKEGQLRRRYEREASLALNRSLSMLLRLRAARTKDEDRAAGGSAAGIVPKQYVGEGWWRQSDASPAPPGCQVIPHGSGAVAPVLPPAAPKPTPAAPPASAASPAHQKRNERREAALGGLGNDPNSFDLSEIRIIADPVPAVGPQRTEPDRPAHPATGTA